MKLSKKDFDNALMVQDACNLSGVVFSFAEIMQKICDDTSGTQEKNSHAICVLFASKIMALTKCDDTSVFEKAYLEAVDISEGKISL